MCLICVDFQKQRMTINDAKRAFREMVVDLDPQHASEVRRMIAKAESTSTQGGQGRYQPDNDQD